MCTPSTFCSAYCNRCNVISSLYSYQNRTLFLKQGAAVTKSVAVWKLLQQYGNQLPRVTWSTEIAVLTSKATQILLLDSHPRPHQLLSADLLIVMRSRSRVQTQTLVPEQKRERGSAKYGSNCEPSSTNFLSSNVCFPGKQLQVITNGYRSNNKL